MIEYNIKFGYNYPMPLNLLDKGSLKRLVPSDICFKCDVCCRFIDKESPLRPYFSKDEIWRLIENGISPASFKRLDGCKIDLIPYKDLYICPFFGSGGNRCDIYELRPLDCRIYPLALMKSEDEKSHLVGIDTKCPYSDRVEAYDIKYYTDLISSMTTQDEILGIIGDFQADVRVFSSIDYPGDRSPGRYFTTPSGLRPLAIEDKPLFDRLLFGKSRLSSHSFVSNFIWRDLFDYYWGIIEGSLCLFAEHDQNIYMPFPPSGNNQGKASAAAFKLMCSINKNPSVSRIEDLEDKALNEILLPGYRCVLKGYEYIYRRDDLISLKGDPYKGKRSSVNHFLSHFNYSYEPFRPGDMDDCLSLYIRWMKERYNSNQDDTYRQMLCDSYSAHRRAMIDYDYLGLIGRVVKINGSIAGYTIGFRLGPDIAAVLFEITDRSVKGLSQFVFRELCKDLHGANFINSMDDSGLESIRKTKLSYHPYKLEPSYIISPLPVFSP